MGEEEDYLTVRSIVLSGESEEEWNALRRIKGDWPVEKHHWKPYRHFSIQELKELMHVIRAKRGCKYECASIINSNKGHSLIVSHC